MRKLQFTGCKLQFIGGKLCLANFCEFDVP